MKRIPVLLVLLTILAACHDRSFEKPGNNDPQGGYKLEQVIVLSRHNIRSPLTINGSVLDSLKSHSGRWCNWSSLPGELTLKGGISETLMGQYFRLWLEDEGFIPANWQPTRKEAKFYANSLQRTVATARYFASGMLPAANVDIKYKPRKLDKTFLAMLSTGSETFSKEARRQWETILDQSAMDSLDKTFKILDEILDYENSDYFKVHGTRFNAEDFDISYAPGDEPRMKGMLRNATSMCDALVMQSYEEPDLCKAAFGHELSEADWKLISGLVCYYEKLLFSPRVVCCNVSMGAMKEIKRELGRPGRKFTFLCGHDSTLMGVLYSLQVEPYTLPGSLEKMTPIGGKLLFERYSKDSEQFVRLRLVYPGWEQLREVPAYDLENPPMSYPLTIKGLDASEGTYYRLTDIQSRINEAIKNGKTCK